MQTTYIYMKVNIHTHPDKYEKKKNSLRKTSMDHVPDTLADP